MKSCSARITEREKERRDKMSDFFSALLSVLPNLHPKASREQIVAGTIDCIQSLKEEIERLENLKKSLPTALPLTSSHGSASEVTVSGNGPVFFGIRLAIRRHLATEVFGVFEKHGAEIMAASVSVDDGSGGDDVVALVVAVTAVVGGGKDTVEMIRRELVNL